MQTDILWKSLTIETLENCVIKTGTDGNEINSEITGNYEGHPIKVTYSIQTNNRWQVNLLELNIFTHNYTQHIVLEGDGLGNWTSQDIEPQQFNGCIDVDIALTPLTNTLPINRLKMAIGETQIIKVIYFDILEQDIKPLKQRYTRISNDVYHYENIPNDFQADIVVGDDGFVIDYPDLFKQIAISRVG